MRNSDPKPVRLGTSLCVSVCGVGQKQGGVILPAARSAVMTDQPFQVALSVEPAAGSIGQVFVEGKLTTPGKEMSSSPFACYRPEGACD